MERILIECDKNNIRYQNVDDIFWFCLADIGKTLNIKNIHSSATCIRERMSLKVITSGGPHQQSFVKLEDFKKLVANSRKHSASGFANAIGMDVYSRVEPVELTTLKAIKKCFNTETMIDQYTVGNLRIDLYFPKYKLAIECDEIQHVRSKNCMLDRERQMQIEKVLGCTFLRFSPLENSFCIFEVIQKIFKHILDYQNSLNVREEERKRFTEVNGE